MQNKERVRREKKRLLLLVMPSVLKKKNQLFLPVPDKTAGKVKK